MIQLFNAIEINAEDEERASSIKYVSIGILEKGFPLNTKIKSRRFVILSMASISVGNTVT